MIDDQGEATAELDSEWPALLRHLHTARGFDFHGYNTNTLTRRIRKRMSSLDLDRFSAYREYLEVHPDESAILFNTILINVTGFFRDPEAWEVVRSTVVPGIMAGKSPVDPVRVWSAGCATGEEAYTLAMLLAEHLGRDAYRDRVRIYATDIDEEALSVARHAAYTPAQVQSVPPPLLARYFDQVDGARIFRADLRRQVIFGRHDLIVDAPISRIDLLVCRNTLMYFNTETQARVLARLHSALNEGGSCFWDGRRRSWPRGSRFNRGPRAPVIEESSPARAPEVRVQLVASGASPATSIPESPVAPIPSADRSRDCNHALRPVELQNGR